MNIRFASAAAIAAVMMLVSCGPSAEQIAAAKEKATADSIAAAAAMEKTWTIDVAASKVNWSGTMIGVKTHVGTLNFASGTMKTKGPLLISGEFVVDMKNYTMNDTNYAAPGSEHGTKEMLMGHLMSPAFFAVDSFPTASLKINTVSGNTAAGDLTVRGKTNPETVTDIVITPNADGTVKATGKLVFDRQKYGVIWSTGAKDMVVQDKIELTVDLVGKAQ